MHGRLIKLAMWYVTRILAQLKSIAIHFATIGRLIWSYARTHRIIAGAVAIVIILGIGTLIYFGTSGDEEEIARTNEVTLIRVGDVASSEPLSVIGEIKSISEANVAPDASGAVRGVYRSLGDFVGAGAIIAELDNGVQRAQLAQAKANLEKVKGASGAGELSVTSARDAYLSAQSSGRNTVQNAYTTVNDAVARKADTMFSNANSNQPRFIPSTSNAQLVLSVESGRLMLQNILARHAKAGSAPEYVDDLLEELKVLADELTLVQEFLSTLVYALNTAIPTSQVTEATIATYRTEANTAITSVTSVKSAVLSASENIKSRRSQVAIAESSLAQGSGGKSADVLAAEATVAAAEAGLEKTYVRAPISGTINRLDIEVGNFVTASIPVVFISNARALEVVVYVSANDLASIERGLSASLAGIANGAVTKVAQALDPLTKKAEVRISVPSDAPFVSGQSVTVFLSRKPKSAETEVLAVPLSALKITPDGPIVFTVVDSMLVENPVTLGLLRGSTVEIVSGLIADMRIVEDARGLKAGQQIVVSVQ